MAKVVNNDTQTNRLFSSTRTVCVQKALQVPILVVEWNPHEININIARYVVIFVVTIYILL